MKIKKFFETILGVAIGLLPILAIADLIYGDPDRMCQIKHSTRYVWWEGIWHALWFKAHFIRNLFVDTNCVGRGGSFMYNVCFYSTLFLEAAFFVYISVSFQEKKPDKKKEPC